MPDKLKVKSEKFKIIVYTDGGSRGNPGPAAVGVVIEDAAGHTVKSYGKSIGERTNNEAEYEAVILALEKLKLLFGRKKIKDLVVEVNMDSELVVNQLSGQYKIEEERLFPLFIKVWNAKIDFGTISFFHVPRERNKKTDQLVNQILDQEQKCLF